MSLEQQMPAAQEVKPSAPSEALRASIDKQQRILARIELDSQDHPNEAMAQKGIHNVHGPALREEIARSLATVDEWSSRE